MNIQQFQNKINLSFEQEDLEVLSYLNMYTNSKIKCRKCNTTYEIQAQNFLRKKVVCSKCLNNRSGGRMTLEEFQEKINKKYPQEHLKVLTYTIQKESCVVQCLNCKNIFKLEHAENFLNPKKQRVCKKCLPNKRKYLQATKDNFYTFLNNPKCEFILAQSLDTITTSDDLVACKCKKCGKINKKPMYAYLKKLGCQCESNNTKYTLEEIQNTLPFGFSVIKYVGTRKYNLYKHEACGFIFKKNGIPRDTVRCPKCDKNISLGERKIIHYFEKYNIEYIYQYPKTIENHLLRFDFYLPKYDIYIEFNGEQHYQPIKYFGGKEAFETQQQRDALKQKYCKDKLIIIPYYDIDKIEEYLVKFND